MWRCLRLPVQEKRFLEGEKFRAKTGYGKRGMSGLCAVTEGKGRAKGGGTRVLLTLLPEDALKTLPYALRRLSPSPANPQAVVWTLTHRVLKQTTSLRCRVYIFGLTDAPIFFFFPGIS